MNTPHHLAPSSSNRRSFLATSLSAAGAALSTQLLPGCASPGSTKRGYIDAHVHVWTPDTKAYPLAADPI